MMEEKRFSAESLRGTPLDVDILGHRLHYSKSHLATGIRYLLRRIPGVKMMWYYLYYTGRRLEFTRSLPSVPRKLKLELTNACNLRCIMCSNSTAVRKRGMMDWALFVRIIHEAKEIGIPHIGMYSTGESLLHPEFCEMAAYAKGQGLYVSVCTNAQLLTKKCSHQLIDAGLDCIRYSVEGASKARYESVRRGGTFEKLLSNIAYFKQLRDQRKAPTQIWIDSVYFGEGFEEAKRFCELFVPYADGIFFYPVCNMGGTNYLGGAGKGPKSIRPSPCINLWATLCITWDGKATLCNYDMEAETVVGDLQTSTIKQIWHSDRLSHFRRLHLEGRQTEMPLCGACSDVYSQPNAIFKPFLVNEKIVRPCLKSSMEAFVLNDRIEQYCARAVRKDAQPVHSIPQDHF